MNKSEDELLVGVAHNVHKKHGVTMFRLEDGTGHIQVCTSPGEEIHNGSFVAFNGFILIKESEPRGYGEGWNENTRHMTYAVINSQREELADCDREVSIFIARKFGLHGNAVILEDDLSSKGSIVNIEFESQVTAGRYIAGVGYKIWVNRLWETTKVIREGYRSTVLHRTEKWADINPIVKDELTKGAARVGTLVYKITETASVPTVHLLCRDESETGTFAVELGWEATKKLCLLPGAVVAFRGLVFFPTRKTIFGTTGTYLYDATNSEYTLIDLPTQRDFEALRPPRPLPNFSGSQLWGLPKMTILDYNKIKPISGCVICCNIVSVKYFNVPNAIPYFRGALAAVFDDGTDVWHGRVENEALKKLLGLLKDDQGCYEWNKRLSMLIVNEKVVNVEATNPVCEAEELLKDI